MFDLHGVCPIIMNRDDDYCNFDLESAAELGEGNILPFFKHLLGMHVYTWREHTVSIRAMTVIPLEYLLSYSIVDGTVGLTRWFFGV